MVLLHKGNFSAADSCVKNRSGQFEIKREMVNEAKYAIFSVHFEQITPKVDTIQYGAYIFFVNTIPVIHQSIPMGAHLHT